MMLVIAVIVIDGLASSPDENVTAEGNVRV